MLQIRNGDVMTVKLTVDDIQPMDEDVVLFRDADGDLCSIKREDIVHVETRPLQVGDVVQIGNGWGSERYELRAIVDDQAMLRKRVAYTSDAYEYQVRPLASLERV